MKAELQRTHFCGLLRQSHVGEEVILNGWIDKLRDHGGVVFANLRDRSGIVQVVFKGQSTQRILANIRPEYVVSIRGTVVLRPEDACNPKIPTGDIEVPITDMTVLNTSDVPPIEISTRSGELPSEDIRLRYRYLDLRRPAMQRNFIIRHRVCMLCRRYLDTKGFLEIETPFLTKSTPEGARDFLVPCRLSEGGFYALPQSPQLFK